METAQEVQIFLSVIYSQATRRHQTWSVRRFTFRTPYPRRKSSWYPPNTRLGGFQTWSQKIGEEKNLFLLHKIQTRFIGRRTKAPCNLSHTKLPLNLLHAHTVTLIFKVNTVTNLPVLGKVHTARWTVLPRTRSRHAVQSTARELNLQLSHQYRYFVQCSYSGQPGKFRTLR